MGSQIEHYKDRVLIVHNYYQVPGGEDTVVANEKRMLENHGHEVFLYSRNNSELKTMGLFRKLLLPFTTIYNLRTAKNIKRIIKENDIDVVHVHNTLNLISPAVYYASLKCKVPVVQTIHNFRMLCPGATFYRDECVCEDCVTKNLICAIKHKCYRNSRLQTLICVVNTKIHRMTGIYGKINYICLTEFNKEKLLQLKQIKKNRIFVKPNFVENANNTIIPWKERDDQFTFVGRLDKLKGIDLLLKAWKKMQQNGRTPKLLICGTGPMEDWCRRYISKNQLNIEMKGFIPNKDARKIIARSRAIILPTQWYEGFPMTIVEAYSVGTAVICSDLGNCGNLVKDGITGWKFKNEQELIDCVMCSKDIVESVFWYYTQKYTEEVNYNQLKTIYGNCING